MCRSLNNNVVLRIKIRTTPVVSGCLLMQFAAHIAGQMHKKKNSTDSSMHEINILNDQSVQYWTKQFGVTEQQLRNAVFIEGPEVKKVQAYLLRHGYVQRNSGLKG